jgi:hypothetical protein
MMVTRTKKTKRTKTGTKNRRSSENPTNSATQEKHRPMLSVFLLQRPLYTFFGNGAGFGNSHPPERSHQIRWTRQLPPAARNLEHNASAAVRLFASIRTRCQIAAVLIPTVVRTTTGS